MQACYLNRRLLPAFIDLATCRFASLSTSGNLLDETATGLLDCAAHRIAPEAPRRLQELDRPLRTVALGTVRIRMSPVGLIRANPSKAASFLNALAPLANGSARHVLTIHICNTLIDDHPHVVMRYEYRESKRDLRRSEDVIATGV